MREAGRVGAGDGRHGGKVETNAGNPNVPEGDAREPAVTITGIELTPVTTGEGALDTGSILPDR